MLGKRLERVAHYVKGSKLADIGSDHAYLPIALIKDGKIDSAVAGEVVDGPYQAAVRNVKDHGLESVIAVRKGSGLEVIAPGEVDCITICGMGGPLIADILRSGKDKLSDFPRLILQSNVHTQAVREALVELGYHITAEDIIQERRHIYEIVVAESGQCELTQQQLKFGPYLLKQRNELFYEKWRKEYHHLKQVKEVIKDNELQQHRLKEIRRELEHFKGVIDDEY